MERIRINTGVVRRLKNQRGSRITGYFEKGEPLTELYNLILVEINY